MRSSGDHGAGDAKRPHVPRAHPSQPYDPRVAGRPRSRPADARREDFTGPQAPSDLPGYEFEAPYRRRDTGEFRQVRDTDGFGRAREAGGLTRAGKADALAPPASPPSPMAPPVPWGPSVTPEVSGPPGTRPASLPPAIRGRTGRSRPRA